MGNMFDGFPKLPCDVCGELFPDPTLMTISKMDRRVACGGCAAKEIGKMYKLMDKIIKKAPTSLVEPVPFEVEDDDEV